MVGSVCDDRAQNASIGPSIDGVCDAMRCDRAHWRKTQKPSRAFAQSDEMGYRRGCMRIDLLLLALSIAVLRKFDELLGLLVLLLSLASAAAGTGHCEVVPWVYRFMDGVWKLRGCAVSDQRRVGRAKREKRAERAEREGHRRIRPNLGC